MNWTRTIGCAAAAAGLWAGTCLGGTIAEWPLTANYGGTTEFTNSVTVNNVTNGSKVTITQLADTGLIAKGWDSASLDGNRYFECSVTAKGGSTLVVEGVSVKLRSSDKGANMVEMRYSTNGGTTWTTVREGNFTADGKDHDESLSFTASSSGTFKFRIYGYGAPSDQGTFRIVGNTLKLLGSATSGSSAPVVTLDSGLVTAAGLTLESEVLVMPALENTTTNAVLSPEPLGEYALVDGKFTFAPVAADAGEMGTEYTLTVTAENVNGTGSAETSVFVMPELPEGSYLTGFEGLKVEKLSGDVDIDGMAWTALTMNGTNAELQVGNRCLGFGMGGAYIQTAEKVLGDGVGAVGFLTWWSGDESYDLKPVEVSISEDKTAWTSVGIVDLSDADGRIAASIAVEVAAAVYVRVQAGGEGLIRRLFVDNLWISPFVDTTTDYEKFLLKYNVTPGDDLTGESEDYDGDGYSNGAEWTADTDPYDETLHP